MIVHKHCNRLKENYSGHSIKRAYVAREAWECHQVVMEDAVLHFEITHCINCSHTHTCTHRATHLIIHRMHTTNADAHMHSNKWGWISMRSVVWFRYQLRNNNQWKSLAPSVSLWDDVSLQSRWRQSRRSGAHALAVCWQTEVMFWTGAWTNIASAVAVKRLIYSHQKASQCSFSSCIGFRKFDHQ